MGKPASRSGSVQGRAPRTGGLWSFRPQTARLGDPRVQRVDGQFGDAGHTLGEEELEAEAEEEGQDDPKLLLAQQAPSLVRSCPPPRLAGWSGHVCLATGLRDFAVCLRCAPCPWWPWPALLRGGPGGAPRRAGAAARRPGPAGEAAPGGERAAQAAARPAPLAPKGLQRSSRRGSAWVRVVRASSRWLVFFLFSHTRGVGHRSGASYPWRRVCGGVLTHEGGLDPLGGHVQGRRRRWCPVPS